MKSVYVHLQADWQQHIKLDMWNKPLILFSKLYETSQYAGKTIFNY